MVDLIVDGVLDRVDAPAFPLSEGLVDLAEAVRWNLRKHCVKALGGFIPDTQQLTLSSYVGPLKSNSFHSP